MDRGAWQATVHAITQSQTQLKQLSMHTFIHIYFSQSREEGFYFLENSDNPRQKCDLHFGKKKSQTVVETGIGSHTTGCYLAAQLYPIPLPTPWTLACQALLSMGFSRQEYWSGLPFPSPRDLPYPGIEPRSPALQADSLPLSYQGY